LTITRRLEEIAQLQVGFAFKSSGFTRNDNDVRLLRGDNIGQGVLRWENAVRWPADDSVDPRYALRSGDVVIAMDRPWIGAGLKFGTVAERDLPAWLVQRVARLRAAPGVDQRYLHYLVASAEFTAHVLAVQTGTAIPHVSGNQLLSFVCPDHSLLEQRAIAEVLGALDDKIAANAKAVVAAEDLIRARVAVTGASCSLGDVAILNKSIVNPQSMRAQTVAHFSLPAFDEGARPEMVAPTEIKSNKFVVPGPAVLLAKLNPRIPRVWDVVAPPDNSIASTEFLVLTSELPSTALWGAVSHPATQADLASKVSGTSGSHQRVRPEEVMELRIPDPRFLDQDVLAAIDALGRVGWSLRDESQTLASTRDELLPLLMSGKVRVKDAEKVVEGVV